MNLYVISVFQKAKSSTTTRFQIQSSSSRIEGFVEVIEILDNSAPLYIGGGGAPNARPVEVEVFTSGDNGIFITDYNHLLYYLPEDVVN